MLLASIRSDVERMHPPRALYCEFPLGRPLGKPGDPAFQRRVLEAAFALFNRPSGPVLEDFPETIEDESASPLACAIPPRHDPTLPPAVDEAIALRGAYERQRGRSGRSIVGHAVDADGVPDAVAAMLRIAEGIPIEDAGLPGSPRDVGLDIRAYYEEAALALADHVPAARQTDAWFFRSTEAGSVLKRAIAALRSAGVDESLWMRVIPRPYEDG